MAAGGPASELIMFIVAIIVAGSVAGALAYVTNDIAVGIKIRGESLADNLRSDFAIINDPENIPVSGTGPYNYTFYIKNVGKNSIPFSSDALQVFIDGDMMPPSNLTFVDVNDTPISFLDPYEVGKIIVTANLSSGSHRVMIVLENGKVRSFVFRIP
ncbi:flagellar protein G [Thermococci archaeon]|nr:MAG: flagellar protein G [Thermococci archaeon]